MITKRINHNVYLFIDLTEAFDDVMRIRATLVNCRRLSMRFEGVC